MKTDKLVAMANQIAGFFRSYPEDEAAVSVKKHVTMFWTAHMVGALAERVADNPVGVDPLVVQAMRGATQPSSTR